MVFGVVGCREERGDGFVFGERGRGRGSNWCFTCFFVDIIGVRGVNRLFIY